MNSSLSHRKSRWKVKILSSRSYYNFYAYSPRTRFSLEHGVWKSQKKSHSKLRAKRATFTFWADKSSIKRPKMVHFGEFLKTRSLRPNSVTRQVSFIWTKIWWKRPKLKNTNATFWVIFKHCVRGKYTLMKIKFGNCIPPKSFYCL